MTRLGFTLAHRATIIIAQDKMLIFPVPATRRDLRGQLERALQEAEAYRADKHAARMQSDLREKEKTELEAR